MDDKSAIASALRMELERILARNIQRMRRARGWSQEVLAENCGIDRTYVSGIERGLRNPSIGILKKLAAALETEPYELIQP